MIQDWSKTFTTVQTNNTQKCLASACGQSKNVADRKYICFVFSILELSDARHNQKKWCSSPNKLQRVAYRLKRPTQNEPWPFSAYCDSHFLCLFSFALGRWKTGSPESRTDSNFLGPSSEDFKIWSKSLSSLSLSSRATSFLSYLEVSLLWDLVKKDV